MKNIREIITDLNVARSNSCSQEKSKEIKDIIQHLLPYAKIEEDLGIDLATLFKALNNGIYFVENNGIYCVAKHNVEYSLVKEHEDWLIQIKWLQIATSWLEEIGAEKTHIETLRFYLQDYGKTWALTTEELLCQK